MAIGNVPLGKIVKFGNISFPGPSSPLNTDLSWGYTPVSLLDAAFPADPLNLKPTILAPQKLTFQYGILGCDDAISPFHGIEAEWNTIYNGFRSHNNQVATLVVNTINYDSPNVTTSYTKARIEKLDLKLTPGHNTTSYITSITFTPLAEWVNGTPNKTIYYAGNSTNLSNNVVPFGSLVSFGGIQFTQESSVIEEHSIEWTTSYSSVPHSVYPLDHYGVSPCPLKQLQATWEIAFTGTKYEDIYNQFNAFYTALRAGPQHALLVCKDSTDVPRSCHARIKSLPITITPKNATFYFTKVTFILFDDWK